MDLGKIDHRLSEDLKLINICCGLTSASSKYPCPYGLCCKKEDGTWHKGEQRTKSNLTEMAKKYIEEGGGDRKKLKYLFNVENLPLIEDNLDGSDPIILKKVPPPPAFKARFYQCCDERNSKN